MADDTKHQSILIVDDERGVRDSLSRVLAREGYELHLAASAREAERILGEEEVAVVISDYRMPDKSGIDLLKAAKKKSPDIEFILITGHGTIEKAVEAMKEGAYDFITKPFKRAELLRIVTKAFEKYNLEYENRLLREELASSTEARNKFIGQSRNAREIMQLVSRVAPLPSTILITGESGTGKEIIARMIHQSSPRARKRFVAVNCGAISENLIESELFGHIKGSFTGAIRDKEGLFKVASGGTLFLDEISTIPLNLQVKLLRALEEHEIMPVGGTRPIPVDVRIVAASNRDLMQEVESGRFREDLYYRLNVVGIVIPPLRDRKDDIPLLVEHFLHKFNVELKKSIKGVSPEVLQAFLAYEWKGNVRELENALERAMILCDDDLIRLEHLPQSFAATALEQTATQGGLKNSVMEFEKMQILNTIKMVDGDKKAAAKLLGLSVSSLYRKISELGLDLKSIVDHSETGSEG